MGLSNITPLHSYKKKKIGFVYFVVFSLIKVIAIYTNSIEDSNMRLIDGMMVLSLMLIVFSKEKIDDERTKQVRYFSLKLSFNILIGMMALMYMIDYQLDFIYMSIVSLLFYLVVFNLSNYFSPSFIFNESIDESKFSERLLLAIMTFLAFVVSYDMIYSIV